MTCRGYGLPASSGFGNPRKAAYAASRDSKSPKMIPIRQIRQVSTQIVNITGFAYLLQIAFYGIGARLIGCQELNKPVIVIGRLQPGASSLHSFLREFSKLDFRWLCARFVLYRRRNGS